jgi:hypothetical protein
MKTRLFTPIVAILCLVGCSGTPSERYRNAAGLYDVTVIGLAIAKPKIQAQTWVDIAKAETTAQQRLQAAHQWLVDNPTLVNVAGAPYPPLDRVNITLDVLSGYLHDVPLIDPTPPATQP